MYSFFFYVHATNTDHTQGFVYPLTYERVELASPLTRAIYLVTFASYCKYVLSIKGTRFVLGRQLAWVMRALKTLQGA